MGYSRYRMSGNVWDVVFWMVALPAAIFGELVIIHIFRKKAVEKEIAEEQESLVYSTEDAPPKIYTVRIKACNSPFAWYYERCGEMFDVIVYDEEMYITTARSPQSYIRKVDCEIVSERFV